MKLRAILASALVITSLGTLPLMAQSSVPLEGLNAEARILRDAAGIPHIIASNTHDLFFMQGWIHAEDRLFQMDLSRRQASGTLAEVVGLPALASDVELRTLGLRRAAARSVDLYRKDTMEELQAYADGVNSWMASHALPPEYGVLELTTVEPWSPVDSAVIAKLIAFGLSFDLDIDLTLTLMTYQGVGQVAGFDGAALFAEDLFRSAPFDPASTVPDALAAPLATPAALARSGLPQSLTARLRAGTEGIRPGTLELAAEYLERVRDLTPFKGAIRPRERIQGSNEWAVSGRLTASGRPIIANDPHLALDTPATFYQNHLWAPQESINVMGSSFPGAPYVILGQNQYICWGATTNPMDVTDTYQEVLVADPMSPSGISTVYQGQNEPVIPLPEIFRYNQIDGVPDDLATAPPNGQVGGVFVPPFTLIVPRRNNGPLVNFDLENGMGISVQYTGFSGTREIEAFRTWNRARNLREFRGGLRNFDAGSQNWIYADYRGNIAYFSSAEMPLREDLQAGTVKGLPPYFLRDGTGGNEWLPDPDPAFGQAVPYQILPFDEMPQIVNPPAGYVVNANNDPAGTTLDNDPLNQLRAGGGLYYLSPGYASGFRAGRITQALSQALDAGPVTKADMAAIQADVVLLDAQVFRPHILAAFEHAMSPTAAPALGALAADPRIAEAVNRLAAWNFTTPTGIPEGYDSSDTPGDRRPPTDAESDASVAATIYSTWRGQMLGLTLDASLDALGLPRPGSAQSMTALRNILDGFGVREGIGASGLDFLAPVAALPGAPVADRRALRDLALLAALGNALDILAGADFDAAFGGSTHQDDYRWGRLHRIVLDHPLGGPFNIPPAAGAVPPPLPDLDGIPVDGGFGVVDASSHSARADGSEDFRFGSGPVRRYVGEVGSVPRSIDAMTALPGGESGVPGNPFYANLLESWLTNDAYPVRQDFGDFASLVVDRQIFVPVP